MSPVNPIESGVGGVWYCKQAALGTLPANNAAATLRLRATADNGFKAMKVAGSEEYVDGLAFSSPAIYTESIGGPVGTRTIQGQIETAGAMIAQIVGVDVVTGSGSDYTHTIAVSAANGTYGAWRQVAGSAVGPWQDTFWDSKISKLTLTCGQDQNTMHLDMDVVAIKPGDWHTAQATAVDSGTDPFRIDEAAGAMTIDSGGGAVAFDEVDGETLEIDRKLDVARGQAARPIAIIPTKGSIMRNFSALVSDNTLPIMKQSLFNTATMTDGLAVSSVPFYVALESTYTRTSLRSLKITTPKVAVHADDFEVFPRTNGGKIPVVFGGDCLKSGGTAALTVVAKSPDSATYI